MAVLRRLLFALLLPLAAYGQGVRYDNFVLKPLVTGGVTPVSGALITVCASAGSGQPCVPKVANIYSDEALTVPILGTGGAGTTNSDSNGNFGFYLAPGSYIVTVTGSAIASYTIKLTMPVGISTNNAFTGVNTMPSLNAVLWAGPGATPTIDAQIAALGANPGTIMISSTYTGAESANLAFNAVDGANYTIYRGSNNITIHDLRASTNKAYGVNYGGTTLGSLARFAVTQSITSPSATTSAILSTNQVTGNLSAGGGAMASGTFEVDTEGALTGISGNTVQALTGQWAVRSTGQTLPLVVGVEGGGGIDRNAGAGGTNITAAVSVQGDAVTASLGTGTIQDTFGVRGFQSAVGTRNNFALVSEGDTMFKDNGCIYGENGSNPALKLLCFGIDNTATGGGNIYSTTNSPAAWKYIVNGGHKNWMAGPQINASDCFEITPSTAANGTTFTTPTFLACPAGVNIIGGISTAAPPAGNTGFQHKRVAGCATAAVLNATCDTTVTWTAAFADANYTAHCSGDVVTSGVPIVEGIDISAAKTGADIRVRTLAITAAAAQFTTLDCTAVHD